MSRKRTKPESILTVSTFITYKTPTGAVFEPGDGGRVASKSTCSQHYELTHTTSRERVCFTKSEVCDRTSDTPLHEQVITATKMLTRRRAEPAAA
jgi:hypothetical protein